MQSQSQSNIQKSCVINRQYWFLKSIFVCLFKALDICHKNVFKWWIYLIIFDSLMGKKSKWIVKRCAGKGRLVYDFCASAVRVSVCVTSMWPRVTNISREWAFTLNEIWMKFHVNDCANDVSTAAMHPFCNFISLDRHWCSPLSPFNDRAQSKYNHTCPNTPQTYERLWQLYMAWILSGDWGCWWGNVIYFF